MSYPFIMSLIISRSIPKGNIGQSDLVLEMHRYVLIHPIYWLQLPQNQGMAAAQAQEGREELLHVQGQEGRPWEDTPRPR